MWLKTYAEETRILKIALVLKTIFTVIQKSLTTLANTKKQQQFFCHKMRSSVKVGGKCQCEMPVLQSW